MKLIDRYVALSFIKNYLISFLVLVGMYIVLDMIFNFDELVAANNQQNLVGMSGVLSFIYYVADFYVYQGFLFFVHLSAIIPVVAASFTLMRMVRFNELSALLSAGVPMQRIAMPIVIVGLILNGLLWVDQEYIIPGIIPQLVRSHNYGTSNDASSFQISAMRDDLTGAKLFAGRYLPTPAEGEPRMEYLSIVMMGDDGEPTSHIKADLGVWNPDRRCWDLFTRDPATGQYAPGGIIDRNLSPLQDKPIVSAPIRTYPPEAGAPCGITPEEIQLYRSGNFVELLSLKRIDDLLQRPGSYGRASLLRVKYFRGVAQISINMIILLLCISSVLTREPQQLKAAATKCIILCGSCLALVFVGQQLAGAVPGVLPATLVDKWPALMAWLPIFIFGPVSVVLLDRLKT